MKSVTDCILFVDFGAQREATHFKNRVLDLVDIFIKKQPASKLIVLLVLPLVEVIVGTGTDERQLSDKATGILRSRLGRSKETPSDSDDSQVTEVLLSLHVRARKAHSSDIVTTLNQCSLYLSRLLLNSGEETLLRIYRESLTDFATRKTSALQPNIILDFIRRYPIPAWKLRSDLVQMTGKAVNGYRLCQTFNFIQTLLVQLPNPVSFHHITHRLVSSYPLRGTENKNMLTSCPPCVKPCMR